MSPLNAQEQTETAVRGGLEGLVADPPGGGVGATPTDGNCDGRSDDWGVWGERPEITVAD